MRCRFLYALRAAADTPGRMKRLYLHKLIESLTIPANASPVDLEEMIKAAFSNVPEIVNHTASMYGFVLLTKVSRGRGARGVWVVNKRSGEFTTQDLQWCVAVSCLPRATSNFVNTGLVRGSIVRPGTSATSYLSRCQHGLQICRSDRTSRTTRRTTPRLRSPMLPRKLAR